MVLPWMEETRAPLWMEEARMSSMEEEVTRQSWIVVRGSSMSSVT
jgi:hypothetical protein